MSLLFTNKAFSSVKSFKHHLHLLKQSCKGENEIHADSKDVQVAGLMVINTIIYLEQSVLHDKQLCEV